MVGLRKLKGYYYARVRIPRPGQLPKDKLIALRTKNSREAEIRLTEVSQKEKAIKEGIEFTFSWSNGKGLPEVVRYTLREAIEDYLKARKGDGLRQSTLDLQKLALDHFQKVVKPSTPVELIHNKHIESFKLAYLDQHSPTTRNINLRVIKTFLIWLKDRGKIKTVPRIKQVNTGKHLPIYLSNSEFAEVQKAVSKLKFKNQYDRQHYQKAFHFFYESGCRLSEPFYAVLDGSFMVIEAENAKTHQSREIELTPELLQIAHELQDRFDTFPGKSKNDFIKRYSKVFRNACKKANVTGKKFHSLRHTFAVRRYLQTRDLYKVAREMGHSSIRTTEIYSQFSIRRLKQDFPDLVRGYQITQKQTEMHDWDTDSWDTDRRVSVLSRR